MARAKKKARVRTRTPKTPPRKSKVPVKSSRTRVAIIGGGNMGSAFARAFLSSDLCAPSSLLVVEPAAEKREYLRESLGCTVKDGIDRTLSSSEIIFLAVKPTEAAAVCAKLRTSLSPHQLVVSIMAGVRTQDLVSALGGHNLVLRCMPNTPAQCAAGMTVYFSPATLERDLRATVEKLLQSTGACLEVGQEMLLDAATAISGSGPAYIFYLIEHYVKAATELGFSVDEAEFLVAQTIVGALGLWTSSGEQPTELRQRVTSKGGTTAAAIETFEEHAVGSALRDGIHRAFERCLELASSLRSESRQSD